MRSWNLREIEKNRRRDFIIECLQEYIDEVDKMNIRDSPYSEEIEIYEIADMYKAIIEELIQ